MLDISKKVKNMQKRCKKAIPYILIVLFSIAMMIFFAYNTSLLYNYIGNDSGIYLEMGRAMARGRLVYRDLFDHKGPLIFVLNMLPQLMVEGTFGVWCLELCFMVGGSLLIYRISRRHIENALALVPPIIYVWISVTLFNGGNYTEEYSNLFSLAALWVFDRWSETKAMPKKYPWLLGVCTAFVFFMRPNNIAVTAAVIIFIGVDMIRKSPKQLPQTLAFGLLGLLTVTFPIIIYHSCTGTLYDMFYATILHNLKYCGVSREIITFIPKDNGGKMVCFALSLILCIDSICTSYSNDRFRQANFLLLALGILVPAILISNHPFMYYWTLAAPLSAYSSIFILKHIRKTKKRHLYNIAVVIIAVLAVVNSYYAVEPAEKKSYVEHYMKDAQEMYKLVPESERDDLFAYDMHSLFIYKMDVSTPCRYFDMQSWMAKTNPEIGECCGAYVRDKKPLWIVSFSPNVVSNETINHEILSCYTEVCHNDCGYLYKRVSD